VELGEVPFVGTDEYVLCFGYVASIIKVALNMDIQLYTRIFARMSSFKRFASEIMACLIHYQT
jgi:uncharacterized membrane protein